MRRRRVHAAVSVLFAATCGVALANGCAATNNQFTSSTSGSGGGTSTGTGHGGAATSGSSGGNMGVGGIIIHDPDAGDASDVIDEPIVNPCGTKCGPVELCDEAHLGLDDNCNGLVDEGCACQAGQAHSCFKGDPSYEHAPGCFDGTEICSEQGHYGDCIGGVHAFPPDDCFLNDTTICHAISAPPYADTHLKTGTGNYSANAVPGSESYTVQCPTGVSQCPMVMAPDDFTALQSGEYTVTYTKMVSGDPNPKTCTFPLFVGAPGLRVELSWEHTTADNGVDLDLHVHQPVNTLPWGISPGVAQDCTWSNCVISDFEPPQNLGSPKWFADAPAMPPTPVNWFNDTANPQNNTCYNDPKGVGSEWASLGQGCHNPRLDADNITCDFNITDPTDYSFCTPENINVDYPPVNQWIRVGVHYYNNHGLNYDIHPEIKIFCNGALSADLGPGGYYMPESPVTFEPSDGAGIGGNRFWIVADVAFTSDPCGKTLCTVKPVYSDPAQKTPFFTIDDAATSTFAPGYPPPP
jgi:hypothetical protein